MKWYHLFAIVVGILLAALLFTAALILLRPKTEEAHVDPLVPPVEFFVAEAAPHVLQVTTQGLVTASTETTLTPEVSGRIIAVSPRFDAGGFFEEGDVLLRIESTQHEAALAEAQSQLAAARLALIQEEATSEQVEQDWRELGRGQPNALARREPQQRRAQADIAAAEAAVAVARRNLEQTVIRAPFAGRVRQTMVDIGDVVTANTTRLATLYAVATAEIRLPLTLHDIGLLNLPESYRGENEVVDGPAVTLRGEYGGEWHSWEGTIERVEGVIDPRTRLVYAVAVVNDPYRRDAATADRPPLKIGLFVEAEIEGRALESAFVVPRVVMINRDELIVIDAENRLQRRQVEIAHSNADKVVIVGGLTEGDRINRTPIDFFIEGMAVDPQPAPSED